MKKNNDLLYHFVSLSLLQLIFSLTTCKEGPKWHYVGFNIQSSTWEIYHHIWLTSHQLMWPSNMVKKHGYVIQSILQIVANTLRYKMLGKVYYQKINKIKDVG
jgi:hypothetical protein